MNHPFSEGHNGKGNISLFCTHCGQFKSSILHDKEERKIEEFKCKCKVKDKNVIMHTCDKHSKIFIEIMKDAREKFYYILRDDEDE